VVSIEECPSTLEKGSACEPGVQQEQMWPDDEDELSKCILFSVMAKDKCGEQFYRNQLCVIQGKE